VCNKDSANRHIGSTKTCSAQHKQQVGICRVSILSVCDCWWLTTEWHQKSKPGRARFNVTPNTL